MKVKEHNGKIGLRLNVKKIQLMITDTVSSLRTDNTNIEGVNCFRLLGLTTNSKKKKTAVKKYVSD